MSNNVAFTNQCYESLLDSFSGHLPYSYVFQTTNNHASWIGLEPKKIVTIQNNILTIKQGDQERQSVLQPLSFLEQVEAELDKNAPYFFIISSDIYRQLQSPSVPSVVFIQPSIEIQLTNSSHPTTWFSDKNTSTELKEKIHSALNSAQETKNNTPSKSSAYLSENAWMSETDTEFLERLNKAIHLLQENIGKMIICRTYRKNINPLLKSFKLYDTYSQMEVNCAASHYANIGNNQYSLGCSPENIFELNDLTLSFDVIAATRGVSKNPRKDASWLKQLVDDKKENAEHMMALERYKTRLETLCKPGSYKTEFIKKIREFKHVRHLHSRLSGEIKSEISLFQLITDSYPPLNSYPERMVLKADTRKEPNYFYGGMVGHMNAGWKDSSCFLNIRSTLLNGNQAVTQGGVGVINHSKAELELLEVKNKLACLMEAFEIWQG